MNFTSSSYCKTIYDKLDRKTISYGAQKKKIASNRFRKAIMKELSKITINKNDDVMRILKHILEIFWKFQTDLLLVMT